MNTVWRLLFAVMLVICAGCASTPKYTFPASIADTCAAAMADARNCIEAVGIETKEYSATVSLRAGEKKISGLWCWFDPVWNRYVAGLCGGKTITVGCHPVTQGEIDYPTLKHEFGHHWLMGVSIRTHDARLHCFQNWFDAAVGTSAKQCVDFAGGVK